MEKTDGGCLMECEWPEPTPDMAASLIKAFLANAFDIP